MDSVIRQLSKKTDVFETDGYGNEIGMLLNKKSSLYSYRPDIIFMIEDTVELINHSIDINDSKRLVDEWFGNFEMSIENNTIYYVSDAYVYGKEYEIGNLRDFKYNIIFYWNEKLNELRTKHSNIKILEIMDIILAIGVNNAFSLITWYMGKILYSNVLCSKLLELIVHKIYIESNSPKKVLLLDLDNTLWGGIAGENDNTPVELSEDHNGLIYKNLQRVIKQMKNCGVVLGIVSKNNLDDAMDIINNNPHMVLKDEDFAIKKINWNNKVDNIKEIASELNIGLNSIVFFDDSEIERSSIKELLPEVNVPDFPKSASQLPNVMVEIWYKYFDKSALTKEDLNKTEEYKANAERNELKSNAGSFEDYLMKLDIVLTRVDAAKHIERITQLLNKTNQFNLTSIRHTQNEIAGFINNNNYIIFAYNVNDKFGDSGLVAVSIVKIESFEAYIEDFVMSCRVMGRNIENAIIEDIEDYCRKEGLRIIRSKYNKTDKNAPVANLFEGLGYKITSKINYNKTYELVLSNKIRRNYFLKKEVEE